MDIDQQPVAVVTGASSGIGKEIAKVLAKDGWWIICTGRNDTHMAEAEREIRESAFTKVNILRANLSMLKEVVKLANHIRQLTDRVTLLVNNAGGMTNSLVMTEEGYEENFAGNHLGPFLLTQKLLPLLRRAAHRSPKGTVRILNTTSDASEMITSLNLDDIQNLEHFSPGAAYCSGKLANVLFTKALATRLEPDGIVAHAVHPGAVNSNFFTYAPTDTQLRMRDLPKFSAAEGADTLVWLATSKEGGESSGGYWHRRQLQTPNPLADDEDFVKKFWDATENLIGSNHEIP